MTTIASPEPPVVLPTTGRCARCRQYNPLARKATTCAFENDARTFSTTNFNCGTMNELRRLAHDNVGAHMRITYREDMAAAFIPAAEMTPDFYDPTSDNVGPEHVGHFVALSWYKDRGTTASAVVVGDMSLVDREIPYLPLTERIADAYLRAHEHDDSDS